MHDSNSTFWDVAFLYIQGNHSNLYKFLGLYWAKYAKRYDLYGLVVFLQPFVCECNNKIQTSFVIWIQLQSVYELVNALTEITVIDKTHSKEVVRFYWTAVDFKEPFEYFDWFLILVVFVKLFCLLNHCILIISHHTHLTFVQTGLYRWIIVLRKRWSGLPVKVSRRILLEKLTRANFVCWFVERCGSSQSLFLLSWVGHSDVRTFTTHPTNVPLLLCVTLRDRLFTKVIAYTSIVRFSGLVLLVDGIRLFGGLSDADVDALACNIFEGVIVISAVSRLIEYNSMLGFAGHLYEVGLDYVLRSFNFCVSKVIHSV